MLHYAKLNKNQICTEIVTRTELLPAGLPGYIKLPQYNQSYLWRKWDGTQWSQETYESTVTFEILQQLVGFSGGKLHAVAANYGIETEKTDMV